MNWTTKFIHRATGEAVDVLLVHDYFGAREHGYKLPSGRVLREDRFKQVYLRSDDNE